MKDAIAVARRLGIISRSVQRDRRPTLEELDKLIAHFIDRRKRAPLALFLQAVAAGRLSKVSVSWYVCPSRITRTRAR